MTNPLLADDARMDFTVIRPEHVVPQVGARLPQRGDPEALRRRAGAQPAQLREDKPHPVRAFAPFAQLFDDGPVDRSLRPQETFQVVGVGC